MVQLFAEVERTRLVDVNAWLGRNLRCKSLSPNFSVYRLLVNFPLRIFELR